jgi:hypothetical protein
MWTNVLGTAVVIATYDLESVLPEGSPGWQPMNASVTAKIAARFGFAPRGEDHRWGLERTGFG